MFFTIYLPAFTDTKRNTLSSVYKRFSVEIFATIEGSKPIRVFYCPFFLLIINQIITGDPKIAVTVPTDNSVGENAVRAIKSHNVQKTLPHK